jgi:hypothetical protein
VSRSTLYRWLRADWKADPLAAQVEAFCDALDIEPERAFRILWPGKSEKPVPTEPLHLNPDVTTILWRLQDPNFPEQEKHLLRAMLETLAARAGRTAPPGPHEEASAS